MKKKMFFCCCKERSHFLTTYPKSVSNQNMKQHAAYLTKSCKYCFSITVTEKELPEYVLKKGTCLAEVVKKWIRFFFQK